MELPGARGQAPGKLILLGEHAVVYGHRALAAAVSLCTRVRLERCQGPTHLGDSQIQDARLDQALALVLPPAGLRVHIETDLPLGRGMGSSAALTIALLRAVDALQGQRSSFEQLHARGFPLEALFHGNPSGLDHAVSALGGAVVYKKGSAPEPVPMRPVQVVVLDTGVAGDTRALVAKVAANRPAADPHLDQLGALTEQALIHLDDAQALGELMSKAQHHLAAVGVSTPQIEEIVALARAAGATGAKLSGAGGGGVVLALTPTGPQDLLREAKKRGIDAFACTLPER